MGIIGLGTMGAAFATRLLSRGYEVHVFNRTPEKAMRLAERGAISHDSPRELASSVTIVLTSLTDHNAVESVAFGPGGFVDAMKNGAAWLDMSTISPDASITHAQLAKEEGLKRLDAPVAGSREPAERGELTILVGGDKDTFGRYETFLGELGKTVLYLGPDGSGHKMKVLLNLHLGLISASFSETLVLAEKMGFGPGVYVENFNKTIQKTYFSSAKGPKIVSGDFEPAFSLSNLVKDLGLAEDQILKTGANLPLSRVATEDFRRCAQAGLGGEDFCSVVLQLEKENGIESK